MKLLWVLLIVFIMGCGTLDQLAGRHWIRHPETGERLWAPNCVLNWDAENKVWRYDNGEICEDGYLSGKYNVE